MLEQLLHYARDRGLGSEPGFQSKEIRWGIVVSPEGRFASLVDLGRPDPNNPKKIVAPTFLRCPHLEHPELKRGGAGTRHFLVDQVDVVAHLLDGEEPDPKLEAKHRYFTRQLRDASSVVPSFAACAAALEDPAELAALQAALRERKAKPADRATFAIQGQDYLVTSTDWYDWWRGFRRSLAREDDANGKSESAATGFVLDLSSGELVTAAPTHPKIQLSDVGGLAVGDSLASFKQEAFTSYGLVQGENAAVSEANAKAYADALNRILKQSSQRLPGVKVAYWYTREPEHNPMDDLFEGLPEDADVASNERRLQQMVGGLEKGERHSTQGNRYSVLLLSGASGRVMVRGWQEGPFTEFEASIGRWWDDLDIVRRDGNGRARYPKFFAVLGALGRVLDDVPKALNVALFRAATLPVRRDGDTVVGHAIPDQAAARALDRFRIDVLGDQPANHARAGLLKAWLLRYDPKRQPQLGGRFLMPTVNQDHPSPVYHSGRLLAVLSELQRRALGDVGAGVVQRFYAAASVTPALVLGRLLRTANFHLDKLKGDGERYAFRDQIAAIAVRIGDQFPKTLNLPEQGLFALGYYQQIAADREASALRRAAKKGTGDAAPLDAPTSASLDSTPLSENPHV